MREESSAPPNDALREDALKWRGLAAKDGGGIDRKAEDVLALLAEIERLREFVAAIGAIVCPRCEGQRYDVDACGACRNVGWLDRNGEAFTRTQAMREQTSATLQNVNTWRDLYAALRVAGYEQAAVLIESWQNEYIPDAEDESLPRWEGDRG